MKAYIVITGALFGLIVVAHILRVLVEGPHLLRDPWWLLMTLITACLSVWAWRLTRRPRRA